MRGPDAAEERRGQRWREMVGRMQLRPEMKGGADLAGDRRDGAAPTRGRGGTRRGDFFCLCCWRTDVLHYGGRYTVQND